ncbi:MAG: carboxypeptidase-like regulatory domain-containing protein [Lutibacter sp.]|jgi:hypothetical protein
MKIELTSFFILTFLAMNGFSQEKNTIISGKISSFNQPVRDVHIFNLTTKLGCVSNDNGEFELTVSLNDTLLFSSIEYEKKKLKITKSHLIAKKINVELNPFINILKEVFVFGLTGNLSSDTNRVPEDTLPQPNFLFKLSDLDKKLPCDEYGNYKIVNAEAFTNPIYLINGAQGSKYNARLEAERKLKREISRKKQFPIKIKKELGIAFFTKNLNIPEEKIDNFLAYCEYRNIIFEYYNNNLLQVIQILREESKNYYEIKK